MFFQNEGNLRKLGNSREAVLKLTEGRSESQKVAPIVGWLQSLYGEYSIIRKFLDIVTKHRKEVLLYLRNPGVEKTSGKADQLFPVQLWLFKHRFTTKEGLLRASYWYRHYLSAEV